jgi:hypothetical protein
MRKSFVVLFIAALFSVSFSQATEGGRLTANTSADLQNQYEAILSMSDWNNVIDWDIEDSGLVSTVYGDTVRIKGAYNSTDTVQTLVVTFMVAKTTNRTFRIAPLSFFGKLPAIYRIRSGTSEGIQLFEQKKLPTPSVY